MLFRLRRKPQGSTLPAFVFSDEALQARALEHKERYAGADPFPHAVIDHLLPDAVAEQVLGVFPEPRAPFWFDWTAGETTHQPRKQGLGHIRRLEGADPFLFSVLFAFNSYPFVHFLETLTGIEGLIPDPHFHGGGLHQILPGGKLDVHADFNYHGGLRLYRRLNALLYLNKGWKPSYNGYLELWNRDMTRCVQSIEPVFNRCVVFNTDSHSHHGHPVPLACPDGVTRKSLAFYYYTRDGQVDQLTPHSTLWQQPRQ